MLAPLSNSLLVIFMTSSMLAIGLKVSFREISIVLHKKKLLLHSLLANFVIIPLIGILFIQFIPMTPGEKVALTLLVCAPGGLSSIQFFSKSEQELAYGSTLIFLLSFLSIFISPEIAKLFIPKTTEFTIPYFRVITLLSILLLLPLCMGILLNLKNAHAAKLLAKTFSLIGTIAFVTFIVLTLSIRQDAIKALGINVVLLMLLFIIISMIIGWATGGKNTADKKIHASISSMRNAALCLAITMKSFPQANVEIPLIAFSALMIPPNLLFTLFSKFYKKD